MFVLTSTTNYTLHLKYLIFNIYSTVFAALTAFLAPFKRTRGLQVNWADADDTFPWEQEKEQVSG